MSTEPEWNLEHLTGGQPNPLTPAEQAAASKALGQTVAPHGGFASLPPLARVQSGPVALDTKYIPPPGLDPRNVHALDGYEGNEGYVASAEQVFSFIHGGVQRLADARSQARKNPAWPEAAQILNVAGAAEKLQTAATLKIDTARKNLTDGIKGIEDMLNGPLAEKAASPVNAEIRAHFKSLPDAKRMVALNEAVKAKDLVTLTAVLGAPAYLSGLSPEVQKHATRSYREATQPDIAKRLRVMNAALELLDQRAGLVFNEIEKAMGARWDVVKKLRTLDSDAQKALLLITQQSRI